MEIFLKNIGKIEEALIKLNGITVIAGENNSGKSTVGKSLFSVFNSFYNVEGEVKKQKKEEIKEIYNEFNHYELIDFEGDVYRIYRSEFREFYRYLIFYIFDKNNYNKKLSESEMNGILNKTLNEFPNKSSFIEKLLVKINEILEVSSDEFFKKVLSKKLKDEFNNQICNIYSDSLGIIKLKIKEKEVYIEVDESSEVETIVGKVNLNTEVIYIDNPFLVDDLTSQNIMFFGRKKKNHSRHLIDKLYFEENVSSIIKEIITTKKIEAILEKLNSVCLGELIIKGRTAGYKKKNTDKVLDIRNLSAGLKTFVILKKLLLNGNIKETGTIVLDEPEIHLHPEWQLVFAELIVLLQKEFGLHILVTTHSPYFLSAIEVYTKKYEIADKCNYYLAFNEGDISKIEEVEKGNLEPIYEKLARPLQDLENMRYSDGL